MAAWCGEFVDGRYALLSPGVARFPLGPLLELEALSFPGIIWEGPWMT